MKFINKHLAICLLIFIVSNSLQAQNETISVWSATIPKSIDNVNYQEIDVFKDGEFYNTSKVVTPTLTLFLPNKEIVNNTAVLICPGGGYSHLAINKEGFKIAKWLNKLGITAFVLKYRLPTDSIMQDKKIGPLQDAQEAIRYIRRNAEKWNIDTKKIGVIGFSAGGHLAATLSTQYNSKVYESEDTISAKPNFSILIYPVISMNKEITHKGSKTNLLGEFPSDEIVEKYSNELQVNAETPITFLVHASDDNAVPVENTIRYYEALRKFDVPVEMCIFQKGGHGFGLGTEGTNQYWSKYCENWLRMNNL